MGVNKMAATTKDMDKQSLIMGKAILKLSMYVNTGMLTLNIHKARHLYSKYTSECHTFIQVCLEPDLSAGTKCCTAIVEDTPHPVYNEKFSFEMMMPADGKRRLHISVWNNNAPGHLPEFLGSMSFGLNSLISKHKEQNGWFYLLKEEIGRRKYLPAILRSSVYQDAGDISEFTPLMPRKTSNKHQQQLPNTTDYHKAFDTVDQFDIAEENNYVTMNGSHRTHYNIDKCKESPKQVRFKFSHQDADLSEYEPLMSTPVKNGSENPYIVQYRKEISAVVERACKNRASTPQKDSLFDDSLQAITGSPICDSITNNIDSQLVRSSSIRKNLFVNNTEGSGNKNNGNNAKVSDTELQVYSPGSLSNDLWIECQKQDTEHDSGICDSLTPSPKSDAANFCPCCRRKYKAVAETSLTTSEDSERVHCRHDKSTVYPKKAVQYAQCHMQQFNNTTYCSNDYTDHDFNRCEHCLSNFYGLETGLYSCSRKLSTNGLGDRSFSRCDNCLVNNAYGLEGGFRRSSSMRRSAYSSKTKNDMHTKIYYL